MQLSALMRYGSQPAELPGDLWETALASLTLRKAKAKDTNTKKKKKKKRKALGTLLLQFTFDLKHGKFLKWEIEECSNLFFEYAAGMKEDVSREYIVVQMDDEDQEALEGKEATTRTCFSYEVDPLRERILRNGIVVDLLMQDKDSASDNKCILFHLMGCSNSQVQRHCYIFRRSSDLQSNQERVLKVLHNLLQLEKKKGIPKRVKYTGLLFSGISSVELPPDLIVEEISTYKHDGFDFTDGPGLISRKLAMVVKEQLGLAYCPSVFQIRYCGMIDRPSGKSGFVCKGVLVVDPTNDDTNKIQVRQSMLKIQASELACSVLQNTLGVCAYSRPSPGRLGQQLVCLLSGNVDGKDLIQLQTMHLDAAKNALQDPFSMAWVLALDGRPHVWHNFHKLLLAEMELSKSNQRAHPQGVPSLYKKCVEAVEKNCERLASSTKVQLPLAASRNLFGAVLPELLHDVLGEGECVVLCEDGPLRPKGDLVIVSRSPAYFPGDIRVLRVVSLPDDHPVHTLRNCILFSTRGNRPDPDKMGGGDLDGDQYLVVWHPILMKHAASLQNIQPASYDDGGPPESGQTLSREGDWIHYAAQTDNAMLGAVESTFYRLAKQSGVNSDQIAELNSIFASLVDRHPTSLSLFEKLKGSLIGEVSSNHCVWEEMVEAQMECVDRQREAQENGDLRQQYTNFQKASQRWAKNPKALSQKVRNEFGYHFLETSRAKEVKNTMAKLDLQPGTSGDNGCVDDEPERHENPTRALDPREINIIERNKLLQFENRARKLFQAPMREMEKIMGPYQDDIDKHGSRKEKLYTQKAEMLASFQKREKDLGVKYDEATDKYNKWIDSRRHHWRALKVEKETLAAMKLEERKARLRRRREWLQYHQQRLDEVNNELASMWYVLESWSTQKKAASERQQAILANLQIAQREYNDLLCLVQAENDSLQAELHQLKVRENGDREACKKWLSDELGAIDAKRERIALERNGCLERLDDLITGTVKKRLQTTIETKKGSLQTMREEQKKLVEHDPGLTGKIDELIEELQKCEAQVESMFCPETLAKATEFLKEPNEKLESLRMGEGHILRKVEQARLSWTRSLKSGTLTSTQQRKEWKELEANLERVLTLEKNRLLGFPRGGNRNGPMPVYEKRSLLRDLLRNSQALVITAGTGCGKSTQIPQYVADDFYSYREEDGSQPEVDPPVRICCTQPRRVAAQKLASRVAEEYNSKLGELVGFRVGSRGRSAKDCVKTSQSTIIEFVTEGLLLHKLARSSEFVKQYDCVIIDEMHERNAEQDLCLSLLRDYLVEARVSRPSFRLVVMSASINAERFSEYLHGCASLYCPGRIFPVREVYLPPKDAKDEMDAVALHAVDVLFEEIVSKEEDNEGDVLIFLSGRKEIEACVSKIQRRAAVSNSLVVGYPLFSRLDQESISAATNPEHRMGLEGEAHALRKGRKGSLEKIRKVICTTNIAETSLTIDGVRFVIESGLANKLRYNHSLRCSAIAEDAISHASTIQRKGRAGRTNSGTCFYLYTEHHHKEVMPQYDTPQILERSVDELILLSLSVCGRSIEAMGLLDAPTVEDVNSAKERLLHLGFIMEEDREASKVCLTESGRVCYLLSSLRPESVRMILHACEKFPHIVQKAIKLGVLLSTTESIFDRNQQVHEEDRTTTNVLGDHLLALEHLEWFAGASKTGKMKKLLRQKCAERGVNFKLLRSLQEDVEACHRELKKQKLFPSFESGGGGLSEDESLLRVLVAGYFHHVVQCIDPEFIGNTGCSHVSIPGLTVYLDRESFLTHSLGTTQKEVVYLDDDNHNDTDHANNDNNINVGSDARGLEDNNINSCSLSIVEEEVKPCFLIYGCLKQVGKINKTFMLDASVVNGRWIKEEAPYEWLELHGGLADAEQENLCSITIKDLGPSILNDCRQSGSGEDFFEKVKDESGVAVLLANFEGRFLRISGTQTSVFAAKATIEEKVLAVMEERIRNDRAHNSRTGLMFGSGMQVKGKRRWGGGKWQPLHEIFRTYGTNRRDHQELAVVEAVHGRSFSRGTSSLLFQILGQEASKKSPFWQCFCKKLDPDGKLNASICFLPSEDCFTFGPRKPKSQELVSKFKGAIHKLSNLLEYYVVEIPSWHRYQVRRFSSVLDELRKIHTGTCFSLMEIITSGEEAVAKDRSLSDYSWLTLVVKTRNIKSIRLCFATQAPKERKEVQSVLRELLSSEAMTVDSSIPNESRSAPKGSEWKRCVMCRRDVLVRFGRYNKSGKEDTGDVEGFKLSLCGCAFCRECFRHGIIEGLQDEHTRSTRCPRCNRLVLAKDCFEIVGRKKESQQATKTGCSAPFVGQEWNEVCACAEANYCQENVTQLTNSMRPGNVHNRRKGWATCTDCGTAGVFQKGYLFFLCRNPACKRKICTRCCQVVTSEAIMQRCASGQCEPHDENE